MTDYEAEYWKNIATKESRMDKLYWIKTKSGSVAKYKRNWAQKEMNVSSHPKKIILKARQLGCSTEVQLNILDDALTIPNLHCGIICHTRDDANHIFENKLRFAYDNLDPITKAAVKVETANVNELVLSNGSSIRVGTSLRSSTLQRLHISEFGKIARANPHHAREIISGALNTVDPLSGGKAWIESTAEGREGHFYEMVKYAEALQQAGVKLSPIDWELIFFPWWKEPAYELDFEYPLTADVREYFDTLDKSHGIRLNPKKKYWYAAKRREQRGDMKREYPSLPEEAFESTGDGLYYAKWIGKLREKGQIGKYPPDPRMLVETVWDLGWSDATAIWGFQRQGHMVRCVFFFQNSGENLAFYVRKLRDKAEEMGITYENHWLPHDVKVHDISTGISRLETLNKLGIQAEVLEPFPKSEAIDAVRNQLPNCYFDEEECDAGIKALETHKKVWDSKQGMYTDKEFKNWHTIHACDAFKYLTLALETGGDYDNDEADVIAQLNRRRRL